jgi:hypothetical protein
MKSSGIINSLSVEQEVGGSSPPNCTNQINRLARLVSNPKWTKLPHSYHGLG